MPGFVRVECCPTQEIALARQVYLKGIGYDPVTVVGNAIVTCAQASSGTAVEDGDDKPCPWAVVGVLKG